MSAKHTTGTWAVNPKRAQVDASNGDRSIPVCQLLWPTLERSEDETEANARLIAAAPDLLAALKNLVLRIEVNGGIGEYKGGPAFVMNRAYEAIAKAEGKS